MGLVDDAGDGRRRVEMESVKENLIAARSLIDAPEKWGKGDAYGIITPRGCKCAMVAVSEVCKVDAAFKVTRSALESQLPPGFITSSWPVVDFNDHSDTTHAEIMSLFDRAIAAQEPTP